MITCKLSDNVLMSPSPRILRGYADELKPGVDLGFHLVRHLELLNLAGGGARQAVAEDAETLQHVKVRTSHLVIAVLAEDVAEINHVEILSEGGGEFGIGGIRTCGQPLEYADKKASVGGTLRNRSKRADATTLVNPGFCAPAAEYGLDLGERQEL